MRRVLILWLLFGSAVYSQSKVGTTGAQFLELPLSARSAGMGDIGTVLRDTRSYLVNPATLGFLNSARTAIQIDPLVFGYNGSDVDYYSVSAASRVRDGESGIPTIGVGVRFLRLSSGPMVERTYERGVDTPVDGTSRTFAWTDTKVGIAVGLGWSGKVDFGIGAGINYIREAVHDYDAETHALDFGACLGFTLKSVDGAAFRSPRMLISASHDNMGPSVQFVEKSAPLPKTSRAGVGVEFAWQRDNRNLLKLFPAIEYERRHGDARRESWKQGLEVWAWEVVCVRVGHKSFDGDGDSQVTYGLGFSTVGLRSSSRDGSVQSSGGLVSFVLSSLDVQLSFAHQSSIIDGWDGTDYYGIELAF